MSDKLKNGQMSVTIEKEEPVWVDRKRWTFFGLPWTFTKYRLTPSKLLVETGFLSKEEEEIRLYRITDVSMKRGFFERMFGLGTITLRSSDTSNPTQELRHIKNPKTVKEVVSQSIETSRRENGVRTSEMVGMPHHDMPDFPDGHHPAMGPEIVPDFDQNGIDDRAE